MLTKPVYQMNILCHVSLIMALNSMRYFIVFDIPDGSEDQGGEQPPLRRRTLSVDEIHKIQAKRNHDYDPGKYICIQIK